MSTDHRSASSAGADGPANPPSTLRRFDRSLPMALMRAREAVMTHFRPLLAEHDLSEQQWRVLRALESEGPCSLGELSTRTFLLGPSLSRMIAALDRRGLVDRSVSEADARRTLISISTNGRELVATIAPESERVYQMLEDRLGRAGFDELHRLLGRLSGHEANRPG